jgi:hypothetical protein
VREQLCVFAGYEVVERRRRRRRDSERELPHPASAMSSKIERDPGL